MNYSPEFKDALLRRMLPPNNESITKISREEGISEQTLRNWRDKARKEGYAAPGTDAVPDDWSTQDKFLVVVETASMNETELAEYARKKGLYIEQIKAWKDACMNANGGIAKEASRLNRELKDSEKERRKLEKELQRKESIPVTVQKGNTYALPIEPQYLKKSFRDIKDRLYADIGTANGRLDQKQFDAPPIESVYEMFAFPYHVIGITQQEDEQLSAAETWPLVASSLTYSGTLGPYWYFVRKTADLGQLESYINRAAKYAGKTLKNGIKEFKPYIEKMRKEIPLSKNDKQISVLLSEYEKSGKKKKKLIDLSEKYIGKEKELCQEAQDDLQKFMEEELHVGDLLIKLVENVYSFQTEKSQKYWARTLCECATELEDARGLYAVISETNFSSAYTAVRKAFRIIDFINYGPKLE